MIDPSGGEVDIPVPVIINAGGNTGIGGGVFNIRTNIPPNAAQGEVFVSKVWELNTQVGYTYDLVLPSGVSCSKTIDIAYNLTKYNS